MTYRTRGASAAALFLVSLVSACGADLDHAGPFDPLAPAEQQARARLTGTVRLEGESDHQGVAVELQSGMHTYTVESRPDGSFELAGIVPGVYRVRMHARYFQTVEEQITFALGATVELEGRRLPARTVDVSGTALAERILNRQSLIEGGVLLSLQKSGSIRTGGAQGAPGAYQPMASAVTAMGTVSGIDGSFTFRDVPAGVYVLVASGSGMGLQKVEGIQVTGDESVVLEEIFLEPLTGWVDVIGSTGAGEREDVTSTRGVTLRLAGFSADRVALGESATGFGSDCLFDDPIAYQASVSFELSPGDGLKTVCAKYFGAGDRETEAFLDQIVLDTTGPHSAAIVLAPEVPGGAEYLTDPGGLTMLALSAADALGAVTRMRLANLTSGTCNDAVYEPAESFASTRAWMVANPGTGREAARTVCVQFQDEAGNWSAPVSDDIFYDTLAPTIGPVALLGIEGVPGRTREQRVAVDLGSASADADWMIVANDSGFLGATWQRVALTSGHYLSSGEGLKTVYVKVRDVAGNESATFEPQITLDQTGPEAPVLALADLPLDADSFPLSSTSVELAWTTPADPNLAWYRLERFVEGIDSGFQPLGPPMLTDAFYKDSVAGTTGLVHHYRVLAVDDLGNASSYSIVVTARPFAPIEAMVQLRGEADSKYFVRPNAGTFLLSADWYYDSPFPGLEVRSQLGFNVLSWDRVSNFSGFNDEFRLRMSNQDNTLVYESRFSPRIDERGFGGLTFAGGSNANIGIDAAGGVHMLYSNSGLWYLSNASGQWSGAARYTTILIGGNPKADTAPDGTTVVMMSMAAALGQLPVDVRAADGTWSSTLLNDTTVYNPSAYQIVMDESGRAHMVYASGLMSDSFGDQIGVRYLVRNADGTWSGPYIYDGASGTRATNVSIARGNARTCMSFVRNSTTNVYYACRTDAGGTVGPNYIGTGAAETAIAVDRNNAVHVAYRESATNDLKLYSSSGGATVTLDGDGQTPAIAVGENNVVHVAFRSVASQNLVYTHNASGSWVKRTLSSLGNQGVTPDIAIAPDGAVHIAYSDAYNGQLGYVRLEPPPARILAPLTQVVDAVRTSDGNVHVAYRYTATGSLYYGVWNGSAWSSRYLDGDLSLNHGLELAVDESTGRIHIAYLNEAETALRYATGIAASWTTEQVMTVDAVTARPQIAIHAGTVHLFYNTKYAVGTAGVWQTESNGQLPSGESDMTVGADGVVHIVGYPAYLIDIGKLTHHYGSRTNWTQGFHETGWFQTPRIRVGAGGKVGIAAELSNDLFFVEGSGTSWSRRMIDTAGDVGIGVDFGFDPDGRLHFVYGDQTSGALKYATDAIDGSFIPVQLATSDVLTEARLFFDAEGKPEVVFGNGSTIHFSGFLRELAADTVDRTTAY